MKDVRVSTYFMGNNKFKIDPLFCIITNRSCNKEETLIIYNDFFLLKYPKI